jgi:hypothetical protein
LCIADSFETRIRAHFGPVSGLEIFGASCGGNVFVSTFCRWGWDGVGVEFHPMRASGNFEVGLGSLNVGKFCPELASKNLGSDYVTAWFLYGLLSRT